MVAAITDLDGQLTGVHRTWLAPSGAGKADLDTPRRAMGALLGHGVRFGQAGDLLAAGEGIETVRSLRMALPVLPALAALSAAHLSAILFPPGCSAFMCCVTVTLSLSRKRGASAIT